jgi:N-acetylneuraminic acid mutarotase
VTPANPTIAVGVTQQFKATGTFSDGTTQDLTSSVTWASGTPVTATISATGLASALKAGTTTISATSGVVTGSTVLTVTTVLTFSVGGTITGLTHAGLVLANGPDTVSPSATAVSFVFGTKLPTGAAYNVTVKARPIAETCAISNGTGTVGTSDVTNVAVNCVPNPPAAWVWESGSKTIPGSAVYGTLKTPDPLNVPGARDEAVSWMDSDGNLWVFGGRAQDSHGAIGANNDLWRFDHSTKQWTWMGGSNVGGAKGVYGVLGAAAPGNIPGARETAYSWTDGTGNFWLFGGVGFDANGQTNRLNDLWKYDVTTGEWTWFSGSDGIRFSGPTSLAFDAVYGIQGVPDVANRPGGRDFGVTWVDPSGNLWLFGGEGYAAPLPGSGATNSAGFLADLWKYTPATNEWTWMSGSNVGSNAGGARGVYGNKGTPSSTNAPGHRTQAVSWTDTVGNLWLFGGVGFDSSGNTGLLNDLWKYDPATNEWTWMSGSSIVYATAVFGTQGVPASTNVPDARQVAIGWADGDDNLWLFGGANGRVPGVAGFLNDLWQYNISTGNWTWISGSSGVNAAGVYGTLGTPTSTNVPGGRSGGISWIDASGNLWHFGGLGVDSVGAKDFLNDLWMYAR